MATKVKPTRLQVTGTPHAGDVPLYVDGDSFQWGSVSFSEGRFLSLWDCTTGQPISFPEATPYTYKTGDYFLVETVSSATPPVNYRPDGSTYTGTASSTTESDEVLKGDFYVYDGTVWLLATNHGKTVSFANLAGQPTDNANLATALNAKADATDLNTKTFYLSSTSDLTNAQAAYDWIKSGKNAIIMYSKRNYTIIYDEDGEMIFISYENSYNDKSNGTTSLQRYKITFTYSSNTVSSISATSSDWMAGFLRTGKNYTTPYTPQYDGSPATKKYVDDHGVPSGGTDGQVLSKVSGSVAWANPTGGSEIEYKTQAEYTALLPGAASDGKHYFIYTPDIINVTGVTLDESSIVLTTPGDTYQLTATVSPNNATDKSVNWSSSDNTIATVSQTGLVTCVTPGTCTITVTTTDGGFTATCGVSAQTVLFDFGDWTNSVWTEGPGQYEHQGTVTKYTDRVTFYNSGNNSTNYLSDYPIDGTQDFLLEFNAYIPYTSMSTHNIGLNDHNGNAINIQTERKSDIVNRMWCCTVTNGTTTYQGNGEALSASAHDYFIKKEGNTLSMGWDGVTQWSSTWTFSNTYYLQEGVYNDTLTIYTARLTYL